MDPLTSAGTRWPPARFRFQPAWFPTLAKPADKQNPGKRDQRGTKQDTMADVLQAWENIIILIIIIIIIDCAEEPVMTVFATQRRCLNGLGGLWGQMQL